jgi:hypothetical protein
MALTPKQVIDKLTKTGRCVQARTLTDWRARGLLPKLTEKGQGQGKGKAYFWTQADILDRVALVVDHKGWDTSRLILVLWCCGFEAPPTALKEAWLEAIETVTRLVSKQDVNAQWRLKAQGYSERLGDVFHQYAAATEKRRRSKGDDMAEFAYETVQLGFAFVFANAIPNDATEEIDHINGYLKTCRPLADKYREYGHSAIDVIDVKAALSMRRFANVFEIRDAIRKATPAQFAEAQFIWQTACRAFILLSGASPSPEIGLTEGRIAQATVGRPALSALMVALQTKAEIPLVQLVEAIAEQMDRFEAGRKAGKRLGPQDLVRFSEKIGPDFRPKIAALWDEFCAGIQA